MARVEMLENSLGLGVCLHVQAGTHRQQNQLHCPNKEVRSEDLSDEGRKIYIFPNEHKRRH